MDVFFPPTPRSHQIPSRIEGKEKQGEMRRWGKKGMDVVTLRTPKRRGIRRGGSCLWEGRRLVWNLAMIARLIACVLGWLRSRVWPHLLQQSTCGSAKSACYMMLVVSDYWGLFSLQIIRFLESKNILEKMRHVWIILGYVSKNRFYAIILFNSLK